MKKLKDWLANQHPLQSLISLVLLSIYASLILFSFELSRYGFNLTDEGFYLAHIVSEQPFPGFSIALFGRLLHDPFNLISQNLVILRRLLIVGLTSLSCFAFLVNSNLSPFRRVQTNKTMNSSPLYYASCLICLSSSILFSISAWFTPSYNHFALIGTLLFVTALCLTLSHQFSSNSSEQTLVRVLIFAGIFLSLMGKLSTGFLYIIAVLLFLFISPRQSILKYIFIPSAFLALLLWLIIGSQSFGSPIHFFDDLSFIFTPFGEMEDRYTLQGQFSKFINEIIYTFPIRPFLYSSILQLGLLAFLKKIFSFKQIAATYAWMLLIITSFFFLLVINYAVLGSTELSHIFTRFNLLFAWNASLFISFSLFGLTTFSKFVPKLVDNRLANNSTFVRSLLLKCYIYFLIIASPLAYSLGTNVSLWQRIYDCSFVYPLLFVVIYTLHFSSSPPLYAKFWIGVVSLAAVVISSIPLALLDNHAHRQNIPLHMNDTITALNYNTTRIFLHKKTAKFFAQMQSDSKQSGFTKGTPILDYGTLSPGLSFVLGGQLISDAWAVYPTKASINLLDLKLNRTSCSALRNAWIIIQRDSGTAPPLHLLKQRGIDLDNDQKYSLVGTYTPDELDQTFADTTPYMLYKPLAPDLIQVTGCLAD